MRRMMAGAAVVASFFLMLVTAAGPTPASAASTSAFNFNWAGGLTAPVLWSGNGFGHTWDVQIHKRSVGDSMDAMVAGHGADCAAPPASHPINMLSQGVYICKNHVMTAINDGGYGEVVLTPDHMVDFTSGTSTITFSVSTLQVNLRDWIELWISPFSENLTTPSNFGSQGNPNHALRFSLSQAGIISTSPGDVARFDGFNNKTILPKTGAASLASLVAPSAVNRTTFEIDISQSHVRFGTPNVGAGGTWWTDTNISPLAFTQGVVQLAHHAYDPQKSGQPGETWHWSGFSISNSLPFSIINGNERSINAGGATTVNFPAPAPANAFLRFSGIGPPGSTYSVSYNGGATWVSPTLQNQLGTHPEIFSSYFTPVPAGTTSVMFRGKNWWGGPWWVRDPAIWSAQGISPVVQPPAVNPPTNPPTNPPVNPPTNPPTNPPVNPPASPPASEHGTGATPAPSAPALEAIRNLVTKLTSAVNPTQDPKLSVIIVLLIAGGLFAVYRVIRG